MITLSRILRHPATAAVITILLIVTGGVGSIYSVEIRRAFPFQWSPHGRFLLGGPWSYSPQATIFWVLVVASALIFYFRQRADDRAREIAQDALISRARNLEHLIRTLPPPNFLSVLAQILGQADRITDAINAANKPDREDLVQGLRHLLNLTAKLAQSFDGNDPAVHYGANIMSVRYSGSMNEAEEAEIQSRLFFCEPEASVDQLLGVLDLNAEFSTTADDSTAKADPNLEPFALPLPAEPYTETGYRVLPGAPMAYFTRQADGFADTAELRQWCDSEGDFTNAVKDELEDYFRHAQFRSFLSIPLFATADATEQLDDDPIAILNIHSDRLGLLATANEPASHFVSIIRPFQLNLAKILWRLAEFD